MVAVVPENAALVIDLATPFTSTLSVDADGVCTLSSASLKVSVKVEPLTTTLVGVGATVSTEIDRVTAEPVFPATSVAVADNVSAPCPIAVTSAPVSV